MKSIIEQYKSHIQKIISNMTGSKNEDIEQEVYIRTWKNLEKYQENGKFKSWINTITANLCRDYLKSAYFKNSKNSVTEEEEIIQISDNRECAETLLIRKQRQREIMKAIDSLKPKLKEVIVMYEMQEMNYEEISKKINCPIGTVRSRLFNARKELAEKLKDLI